MAIQTVNTCPFGAKVAAQLANARALLANAPAKESSK